MPSYAARISVVAQFHYIFHESLKTNLLVAKPDADEAEIESALKQTHLKERERNNFPK
ncbi:MAG: ABC transporter ATP-binding protein [Desulfobacteraceae bacterium]|nr:ABC transporter ATP-binding protein [Desulfobacteraceae bacterium]MBC2720054.1 ABC transporter ATP-binding protein [Desulfobacteraceae bacterium]